MYNTTDDYKSKIYDTVHFLKVYINDVEIESKYILDCRPSSTLFTNGEIELGSTPSQTVELKLYKSVVPATINKVEIKSGITGEIVPLGVYNVDKAPTSDDYTVTLSLADNMIKFEFNYDGSKLVNDSDGKVKIIRVLQDICSKANVELGSTSFLNMNKVISVYDNTVSARTYLSYIAEQAGGFAFIGRDGKLYIKSFKYALGKKIGEGKSIVIEKTNNLRAKTVIKGEHSQKTTEGKNVLNPKMETKTANGITIGNNGSNVNQIIINGNTKYGTAMSFDEILQLEENEYYTMSFRVISGSCTNYATDRNWAIKFFPEQYKYQPLSLDISAGNTQKSLCFKASGKARKPYFWFGWEKRDECIEGQTGVFKNLVLEMQIEKGKSLTSFEYYTGAKPSPNTNYQQKIETVGDNVNIIDVNNLTQALLNVYDGTLILNQGWRCTDYLDVFYKEYNFSWESDSSYFQVKVCFYDKDKKFLSSLNYIENDTYSKSFKVPNGARFMKLSYSISINQVAAIREKIKLEKGSKATPYSPYGQGSVEVVKKNSNIATISNLGTAWEYTTDGALKNKARNIGTELTKFSIKKGQTIKINLMLISQPTVDSTFSILVNNITLPGNPLNLGDLSKFPLNQILTRTYTATEDTEIRYRLYGNANSDIFEFKFWVNFDETLEYEKAEKEKYIIPVQQEMLDGDYIDTVEHHEWHKLILTGTENVIRIKANHGKYIFGIDTELQAISTKSEEIKEIYCNVATQTSRGILFSNITADCISYGSDNNYYRDIVLSCMNTYNMTVEEFKAWIKERYDAGNPVVIYYQLATPINLALTEEQKKVLKEIHNMDLYEDYTIIESDAEMQVNFARAEIPIRYFQNFEWGAKYKLSKIRYEDGIRVFEKGDETGNTLYINPDNMFIVDQDQIDNIYDELKDLELYSFKGDSIVDPALDIGDIVVIDGKQVLYCGSSQYSGRWKASISSEIKSKERQETTVVKKPSQKTINRRVQSSIDQANAKITQLIEAKDETSEILTKHEQTMEGFTNTVKKVEKDIEDVKSTANSSVKKVEVKYALSDSSTEAPATGWNTTAPEWVEGKYMWQKTVTTFVDGTVSESNATCIQGAKGTDGIDGKDGVNGEKGDKGETGATGKGIKSVQEQYYLSTSNTKQTGGAWKNIQDEWEEGKYIWTRSFITWTDNTTSYTTPCLADSINKANQTASDTAKNLENNYNTKSEVKSLIEQSANSITQRIDDIEDITQTAKGTKTLEIESAVEGQLLELRIYGNNNVFKYQYLSDELYLSDNLILGKDKSIIIVTDEAGNKAYYDLKIEDALRQNGNIQDEYILDIENNSAKIIRRINKDGSVKDDEEVELLEKVEIHLSKGKNILEIKDFSATMYAKWVVQNNYTNLFATKVEMNSSITERAEEINLEVRKKVGNDEVISKINQSSEAIQILANKLGLTANDILDIIAGNSINLSSKNVTINSNNFNVDKDGKMTCNNATVKGKIISSEIEGSTIKLGGDADHPEFIADTDDGYRTEIFPLGLINEYDMSGTYVALQKGAIGLGLFTDSSMEQTASIEYNEIRIPIVSQTSLKEYKKNFEKIQYKAIDVIKDIDIYEYNLKHEKDTDKKHIGFVIGNGFNYSKKVTSSDNKGVDSYSFISLCCKAIQELSSKVEELEKKVKEMEGDK